MEDFARNARVAGVKKIYTRVLWNDLALIRFFDSVGFIPGRTAGAVLTPGVVVVS